MDKRTGGRGLEGRNKGGSHEAQGSQEWVWLWGFGLWGFDGHVNRT